jgi:hypothetical protein
MTRLIRLPGICFPPEQVVSIRFSVAVTLSQLLSGRRVVLEA